MKMKWFVYSTTAVLLALGLASAYGQTPAAKAPATPPKSAPTTPAPTPPVLTELQLAHLAEYDAEIAMLNQQAQPILERKQAVIQQIEAEHPGYHWQRNPMTGQEGLQPDPPPPAPTPKP